MSINNSYFNRNNTIVYQDYVNTGRNPVMQLFYGDGGLDNPIGYSRFIFNLNLDLLREKILDQTISTNCGPSMSHILKMTNTSAFDLDLLNTSMPDGSLRATSFDLNLYRIPKSGLTGATQNWDEGVGYDYYDTDNVSISNASLAYKPNRDSDQSYSSRLKLVIQQ